MTTILSLYKAILHSVDCAVDHSPDFTIRFKLNKVNELIHSKSGKILILPTKELLDSNTDWEKYIAFHPACESILGGQSEILNVLLDLINSKIYRTMIDTAATIVSLAQKEELRSSLSLAQSELTAMFNFNKAAYTLLGQVAKKNTQFTGEFPLVSIRLDRGGTIGDVKYSRLCTIIPHFNLNEKSICGCTTSSKSALTSVKELFAHLLPDQLVFGTNSKHQPYLTALLEGFYRAAQKLNSINKILGKYTEVPQINITWHDDISELQTLYKQGLPQSLAGNLGDVISTTKPQPKSVEKEEYQLPTAPVLLQERVSKEPPPWDSDKEVTTVISEAPSLNTSPFGLTFSKTETPLTSRQPNQNYRQEVRHSDRVEPRRPLPNFNNLNLSTNQSSRTTIQPGSNYGAPPPFVLGGGTLPLGRRRG
jgi:hypothetical protein